MPRYFFDIEDGASLRDGTGTACSGPDEVRKAAPQIRPEIARDEAAGGDRHTVTVIVRDAERRPGFTTTLNLTGLWLIDR